MSRRARTRANARPWQQLRDADGDDIEALAEDGDEHSRERAWQEHEREQQQQGERA